MAALFVVQVARGVTPVPPAVGGAALVLLLLQPIFTLRLVGRLRHVPRWLFIVPLVAYAAGIGVGLATGGFQSPIVSATIVIVFFVTEAVAGAYLALEAVDHAGAARVRLLVASASTILFGTALLAAGAGIAGGTPAAVGAAAARVLALLAGLGYVVAFLPPRWLRRVWQASAGFWFFEGILKSSATGTTAALWTEFLQAAREASGVDVVVLLLAPPGQPVEQYAAGTSSPIDFTEFSEPDSIAGLVSVVAPGVQNPVRGADPRIVRIAEAVDARFYSVVPIAAGGTGSGCALLLSHWRTLFTADDVELIAATAARTALLAERQRLIADQRRLAEQLATTVRALEGASRAKSDFLASMSHELRTPLNAIIGFSELMRGEPADGATLRVPAEWVEHIHSSGQHLLGLINDVLDITKVEAGRLDLQTEPLDVAHAVTESVAGLRPLADRKRIAIANEVDRLIVAADRGRLRQILYNLLSNAIKFTPEGGSVRITSEPGADVVRISVADTGIGIAPEDQARVFEEFQQVGSLDNRQEGTGLGLALTRRLVEAHRGSIELESAVGRGTTFTFSLPRPAVAAAGIGGDGHESEATRHLLDATTPEHSATASPAAGRTPAGGASAGGASRRSVLVIEDEPSAVRLLRTYIESDDVRVRVAHTGEAGLEEARREPPDAIVLDVLLPGMDGWDVLRELKSDAALRDVPVIIVTVVDEREVGLALGAVDYFVKPVDRGALLDRLDRYTFTTKVKQRPVRVLAVDDDPAAVAMVEAALAPEGFTVVGALDGRQAIDLARKEPPDLVICDLLMPELDGFGVVSALKAEERTRRVPILILTAHDLSDDDKARLNGNILGVVGKGQAAADGLREWLTGVGARTTSAAVASRMQQP